MTRLNRVFGSMVAAIALIGLPVVASATITGSAHDFSSTWNSANGEICVVCHTPHDSSNPTEGPLWNHDSSVATYTMYADPSGTFQATAQAAPAGVSKLCLSCHDGTVALDAYGGSPGGLQGVMPTSAAGYVGTDLSDDHPISFTYDTALATLDGGLHDPSATSSGIPGTTGNIDDDMLFGGAQDQLECGSCHDPHRNGTIANFLQKENTASALCLTCHDK